MKRAVPKNMSIYGKFQMTIKKTIYMKRNNIIHLRLKIAKLIILAFCFPVFSACNNWLDVTPLGQTGEDKMFENADGFHQALAGSYSLLLSDSTYSTELTCGFPDEIVRYWNQQSEFYKFNYSDVNAAIRLGGTWRDMYKTIANLNLLLDHAKDKIPATLENYNLVVGEAKALRAYLHLDLLQLFGPVLRDGMDKPAIPYREEFSNIITRRMSAREVLGKIKTDLEEAYQLLKQDPINTYGRKDATTDITLENKAFALRYRGLRMNYYAVCATMARMYLLLNDKPGALKYAQEVINADHIFQLVKREDLVNDKDLMFQREIVWGLYDPQIKTHLSDKHAYARFNIDVSFRDYVYTRQESQGGTGDYRLSYWWEQTATTPTYHVLAKYKRTLNEAGRDVTFYDMIIGMIRLSEVYYIAAEANLGTNNAETYRLLNIVRKSRNIEALSESLKENAAGLLEQIVYEYQKEFWGEGRLFYLYKRLYHDIIVRDAVIPASHTIFELPLPKDEIEYGGNK